MKQNKKRGAAWWLFWSSFGLLIYTYLIFPALVLMRAYLKPQKDETPSAGNGDASLIADRALPSVSFIIAAYNEAQVITEKIENSLTVDYPRELIEVIVASDGSEDGTNEIVAGHPSSQVRLLALPRQGKNRTINHAVTRANGEILIFTDADSMFASQALHYLVKPFQDPQIGGVAGSYRYNKNGQGTEGERAYWKFDQKLKTLQSMGGDLVGATGHIYAIRRDLFSPVPEGVTDDAFISREILGKHKRLVFEPRAVAYGPIADSSGEFRRKVRITTRGLKAVWEQRYLLNPFEYGFYSLQLFSHKVLRRMMFLPMFVTMATAPLLWSRSLIYQFAAVGQLVFHIAAAIGYFLRHTPAGRSKILGFPYYLDMTHLTSILALKDLFSGRNRDVWQAERATVGARPAENK